MTKQNKKICVLGLGYIGLPTASMFATHGYTVYGVDINPVVVQTLQDGKLHIEEPGLATIVKAAISSDNLHVSSTPKSADVYIIAVPTPYHKVDGIPQADLSYVNSAMKSILPLLEKGNMIILESTSPPGTVRDLLIPIIEKETSFKVGKDIGVAYCPERVIPGQALKELIGNDRIVGAVDEKWGNEIKTMYKSFVAGDVFLTEPTVAEVVKILENTYRDVNIALANEMAQICEKLDISVWEVIQLANRHPRVNVHKPGPGVGGHCISVDPWFLVERFPEDSKLIHLSRKINDDMPQYVADLIVRLLDGKTEGKVTVLGLAYKGNVDDDRESPAIAVLKNLQKLCPKIKLGVYDPHVKSKDFPTQGIHDAFSDADLAVLLSSHDEYRFLDPKEVGSLMKTRMILDAHNFLKAERWVPAGFEFHTLGAEGTGLKTKVPST